jgi:hypothetical protein
MSLLVDMNNLYKCLKPVKYGTLYSIANYCNNIYICAGKSINYFRMKLTCKKFDTIDNNYPKRLNSAVCVTFNCEFHISLMNKI